LLQEFYVTAVKKLNMAQVDATQRRNGWADGPYTDPGVEDVLHTIDLHRGKRISS
jgi:hypothetical protein